MSFSKLKLGELRLAADAFAVDLDGVSGKAAIIKEIEDNGVTWEMYVNEFEQGDPSDSPTPVSATPEKPAGPEMLVRMDRRNPVYEVCGVRFTSEHPFALVSESIAQDIFDSTEGFRPATPRELEEYYR
jgi:hypothetical protein